MYAASKFLAEHSKSLSEAVFTCLQVVNIQKEVQSLQEAASIPQQE